MGVAVWNDHEKTLAYMAVRASRHIVERTRKGNSSAGPRTEVAGKNPL